jgi:hypothetical protein
MEEGNAMRRSRYIGWVVDYGRSPEWLLREYRNKVKRVFHIRQVLRTPKRVSEVSGRPLSPLEINTYKRSLPIREKDTKECREAIRWLAHQGLIAVSRK